MDAAVLSRRDMTFEPLHERVSAPETDDLGNFAWYLRGVKASLRLPAFILASSFVGFAVNGDRRRRELWRFTCEGYLGDLTRELSERQARTEAELKATVDGEEIPYRMLRPTIANEAERAKRQRLEELRAALGEEHLNPIHLDAARTMAAECLERAQAALLAAGLAESRLMDIGRWIVHRSN